MKLLIQDIISVISLNSKQKFKVKFIIFIWGIIIQKNDIEANYIKKN